MSCVRFKCSECCCEFDGEFDFDTSGLGSVKYSITCPRCGVVLEFSLPFELHPSRVVLRSDDNREQGGADNCGYDRGRGQGHDLGLGSDLELKQALMDELACKKAQREVLRKEAAVWSSPINCFGFFIIMFLLFFLLFGILFNL